MSVRRKSLSTGDIAGYCQVTPATVVNWIKAGKLAVYTTPGGQYRMEVEEFLKFLGQNAFPIPEELRPTAERRLLLIDDDPALLEQATLELGERLPGLMIAEANHGYDGLLQIGAFKPHAIVVDVLMHSIDGLEFIRRLRGTEEGRNLFIIALCAATTESDLVRKIKRAGVDGFLPKPVQYPELVKVLARLLRLSVV